MRELKTPYIRLSKASIDLICELLSVEGEDEIWMGIEKLELARDLHSSFLQANQVYIELGETTGVFYGSIVADAGEFRSVGIRKDENQNPAH